MVKKKEHYHFNHEKIVILDEELGIDLTVESNLPKVPKDFTVTSSFTNLGYNLQLFKDANGNVFQAHIELKGQLHGQWILYYLDGSIKSELYYKAGTLHGPSSFYSDKGKLISHSWYIDGKRHGKFKQFYLDGNPYSIQRYDMGMREGKQEYFYEDGNLKTLMTFKADLQTGTTKLYYPNRQLKREIEFENGKKMGRDRFWNKSGLLIEEAHYQEHLRYKTYRKWHSNGQLALEYFYHNSDLYDETTWTQDGKKQSQAIYNPKDQSYTCYLFNSKGESKIINKGLWNGNEVVFPDFEPHEK
ncbi:MAG: hypothetical protein S4CHLAM6_15360 [Chlamydiae bacterium]|nr:hypothetical protein [Chlamydiota bacterium]